MRKMNSNKNGTSIHRRLKRSERLYKLSLSTSAYILLLLLAGIFITLVIKSWPAINEFGFGFVFSKTWNPVFDKFGALPFIVGTIATSLLALAISFPFSFSIAFFLGEYFKKGTLSSVFTNIVELLAGIPSVIYGFAALFFIVPLVRWLEMQFGVSPIGLGILTASIVLAVMIIPYSASIAREVISLTASDQREAGYALGATRFEVIRHIIFPQSRSGMMAGTLLAFGRALGETMAVTMVIGNANALPTSIFSPSNTMASVIANEFAEATSKLHLASLVEIGLLLFIITAIFNILGKLYINRLKHQ